MSKTKDEYDKSSSIWISSRNTTALEKIDQKMLKQNRPHVFILSPALEQKVPDLVNKKVLSLGCGSGEEIDMLKSKGATDIVGIDISEELIAHARENHPDCKFVVGNAEDLAFKDNTFDYVFSNLVLHYFEDWTKVTSEIFRVMAQNGTLLFSVIHPVKWSAHKLNDDDGKAYATLMGFQKNLETGEQEVLGDYLNTVRLTETWMKSLTVTFYSRSISSTFKSLKTRGFKVTDIIEPKAIKETEKYDEFYYEVNQNYLGEDRTKENEDIYQDTFNANFDWVLDHKIKMFYIRPNGDFIWEPSDIARDWAKEHNKKLKYHTLIWHNDKIGNPDDDILDWYDNLPSDQDRLIALEEHVRTIIARYKGDADSYDLVNHVALHLGNGNFMNTGKTIDEIIVLAFKWANEEDDAPIYVANASAEVLVNNDLRDVFIKRLNDANAQLPEGSKIDAAGVMGHFGWCSGEIPDKTVLKESLDLIHEQTGLKIQITELDFSYDRHEWTRCGDIEEIDPFDKFTSKDGDVYDTWFDYQGKVYGDLYDLFIEHEAIDQVFSWGFYDGKHWRANAGYFWGPDTDDDFGPKPAYLAIKEITCTSLCSERQCGYDGCGGTCGSCEDGESCTDDYQCSSECVPVCSGKECGDDGCNGSCGSCEDGESCNAEYQCIADDPSEKVEDINNDGVVDILDISLVLSKWGEDVSDGTDEDVNGDKKIDILDISSILGEWS